MKIVHILNGDLLKDQFPRDLISGEIIVARECLVDGDVKGENLSDFFQTRASSIRKMYGETGEKYHQKVVPEINRIVEIDEGEINFWFEDDLFCQVNFWFVCSLLKSKKVDTFLVRPTGSIQYGFGGMKQNELVVAFENRKSISSEQLVHFAMLWSAYQNADSKRLRKTSELLKDDFPFLPEAVKAQTDREAIENQLGRPEQVLLNIMNELGDDDFRLVFQEFCKREPIYGFGDLQVKRLFDQLKKR